MTDPVRSTPTETRITHDLKLSDGLTDLGLILCNSRGIPIHGGEPWSLRQSGSSRVSLQIRQGDANYSDYQLPYTPFTQKDWSGGRGNEDFEKDTTRYYDGNLIDTKLGDMILSGKASTVNFGGTTTNIEPLASTGTILQVATSGQRYASMYSPVESFTFSSIDVIAAPGAAVTVEVILDSGGSPSAAPGDVIATATSWIAAYTESTSLSSAALGAAQLGANSLGRGLHVDSAIETRLKRVYISGSMEVGTSYWIVVTTTAIGYGAVTGYTVKNETAPNTWASAYSNKTIYFKIVATVQGKVEFFEYKGGLYAILKKDNASASDIYLNGFRFVAGTGSSQNKVMIPAGQGITTDQLVGCVLLCVGGTNYGEEPNYKTITSNTTTYIEFETGWQLSPDNTSEFVVLGCDIWNKLAGTGITGSITDVCVANEIVYFAQGETIAIRRMREYNNAGTWTRQWAADGTNMGTFLELLPEHTGNFKLWKFNNPSSGAPTATYADLQTWGTDLDLTTSPDELLENLGFEDRISTNNFYNWTEEAGNGAIEANSGAGNFHGGTLAVKLTVGADTLCYIYQNIPVYPGNKYQLKFWVKGDGTDVAHKAQYSVYDNDGSKYIVGKTSVSTISTTYYQVTKDFTVPKDCYEAKVAIWGAAHDGAICYIDDTSLLPTEIMSSAGVLEKVPPYPILIGDARSKITNVLGYGDPLIPYVIKEDEFGSIANKVYAPVPISELRQVRSETNGKAAIQFGVYLFMSVLEGFERYYENRLDDIGPNRDEGLPSDRRGVVSCVTSYPGGLYLGVDAGEDGYSCVLFWNQIGYNEVYRAPIGQRIRSIFIQNIPGGRSGRLWVGLSNSTRWIPICLNPRQQPDYRYETTGYLVSSWFNGGFKEINKFWKSVQVYAENLTADQNITISYQLDNDTDADLWHALPETFDTSPMQEVMMSSAYTTSGKRWRYKITLTTSDDSLTPRVKAITIPAVTRLPPNKAWNMTVLADDAMVNRQGNEQHLSAKLLMDQLETWANSALTPLPLTMNSAVSVFDNKRVFIEPPTVQPIEVINADRTKSLKAIVTLSVYEA